MMPRAYSRISLGVLQPFYSYTGVAFKKRTGCRWRCRTCGRLSQKAIDHNRQ